MSLIAELEAEHGKPVIACNAAVYWQALRMAGIDDQFGGYGRLFEESRVVIIGGGAVGAACLYHLAEAGVSDCLLIEKDELTSGSTWHAAGNIPTYAASWLGMRAGNYAWNLYKDGDKVDCPSPIAIRGILAGEDRMDLYRHLVGISKSAGFDLGLITPDEMRKMHPYYTPGDSVIGAIHDPYEGDIDPSQLTQARQGRARERRRNFPLYRSDRSQNRGRRFETSKGRVTCETVVNTTGFYGNEIARMAGGEVPVVTLEHQYLVTETIPQLEQDKTLFPLIRDPDIRFYLRRERSGFLFAVRATSRLSGRHSRRFHPRAVPGFTISPTCLKKHSFMCRFSARRAYRLRDCS